MARRCWGGSKWVSCASFETESLRMQFSLADSDDAEKFESFRHTLQKKDGLGDALVKVLEMILDEQPKDPVGFIRGKLGRTVAMPTAGSMLMGNSETSHPEAAIMDLLDLPNVVARREPSRIIDIGAEEIGFYSFWRDRSASLRSSGKKMPIPFLGAFIEAWRVDQFRDAVIEEFSLDKIPQEAPPPTLYAGVTDQRLVNAPADCERTVRFVLAVEKALSEQLQRPARLRLFAPSRLLLLKMELRAIEWLVSLYNGELLAPQVSKAFYGILSAHSFSCQLAMSASGSRMQAVQLWTLPIGNGVPLAEGLFTSSMATMEQRQEWQRRIRHELQEANFPTGVTGLWIGISAVYHAGREACPAEVVLSRSTAAEKIQDALSACDPTNVRSVANLILVHTLITEVFSDTAWFLFKREWSIRNSPDAMAATWPLGLYTNQLETMLANHRRKTVLPNKRLLTPWRSPITAIFDVPFLAWPATPCYLLDFGSGETGAYAFQPNLSMNIVDVAHEAKVPKALFDGFVKPNDVQGFMKMVMEEFKIAAASPSEESQKKNPPNVVIIGGLTGLHREMLSTDEDARLKILQFAQNAEAEMERSLKKKVCIRLFVPSGEMEAELELRAVEWLLGVCPLKPADFGPQLEGWMTDKAYRLLAGERDGDTEILSAQESATPLHERNIQPHVAANRLRQACVPEEMLAPLLSMGSPITLANLKAKVKTDSGIQAIVQRCAFGGTLSCGGGSAQLTLSGSQKAFLQHFSAPVGNKTPVVTGIFDKKEVKPEQRETWSHTVRGALSQLPSNVSGFFVGISATYHAAKLVGIAERLVMKSEVIRAFESKLKELPPTDIRNISNLILVKELVQAIFHDTKACFVFKRNWHGEASASKSTYVAGWALGMYSSQFDNDLCTRRMAARRLQRRWRRIHGSIIPSSPKSPKNSQISGV